MIEVVDALARHGGAVPGGSCPTVGLRRAGARRRLRARARAFGLTADNIVGPRRDHARRAAAPRRRAPRPRPVLGAARRGRRQLRDRDALRGARAPGRRGGALQRLVPLGRRGARGVGGMGAGDRPAADLGAAARHRQRHRGRAVPRLRGPARRPARAAAARRRVGDAPAARATPRSRSAGATGRTTPRTRFSAKSHYVRKRLPGRVRDALLAELARGGGVAGLGNGLLLLDAYGGALNRPRPAPRRSCTATSATRSSTSPTTTTAARRAARGCGACTRSSPRTPSGAYQNYLDPEPARLAPRVLRAQPRAAGGGAGAVRPRPPLPLPARGLGLGGGDRLARLALGRDLDDVPGQPELLERPDHAGRDVDLPRLEAVARGGREGVVVVVPRLAEGQRRQPQQVARLVARVEAACGRRSGTAS